MKAFAVLYDGIQQEHFAFFDHLKTAVELQYIGGVSKAASVLGYNAALSLKEAVLRARDGIDILFLPGRQSAEELAEEELTSYIKQIAESSHHVIIVGSAVALMAGTSLLNGFIVAVEDPVPSGLAKKFPNVQWKSRDLYRAAARYWSTPGSLDNLICLALILEASRKGHIAAFYPHEAQYSMKTQGSHENATAPKKKSSLGQKLMKNITRYPSPEDVMYETIWFTERLTAEGYLDDASLVLTKLSAVIPETPDNMDTLSRRGFEVLWHEAGKRPDVPWERPGVEELKMWGDVLTPDYPRDGREKMVMLETLARRIRLGDTVLRPYSLAIAANLASECGKEEESKAWLEKQVKIYLEIGTEMNWQLLLGCRALAPLILSGFVATITVRTAEEASQDSADVISALEGWSERQSNPTPFKTPLSYDEMLIKLEPRKWASDRSIRLPPASHGTIASAESRLETSLPDDYKAFLRISNGMKFMPSLDLPGLRKVEQLQWEEAAEIGLDEFQVDLGRNDGEYERLGRILMISDTDSEEMVWCVEPNQVEKAGEKGWRVVFWTNWMPKLLWHASFRSYMDQVMAKDEELALSDED